MALVRTWLAEHPPSAWIWFLEVSLRALNWVLFVLGLAVAVWSVVTVVQIQQEPSSVPPPPPSPPLPPSPSPLSLHGSLSNVPWFLYAFGALGLATTFTASTALLGIRLRSPGCMSSHVFFMCLLLTGQACAAVAFFMDRGWQKRLPDIDEKLKEFLAARLQVIRQGAWWCLDVRAVTASALPPCHPDGAGSLTQHRHVLCNPQPRYHLASTAARIRSDCRQQRRRTLQQGASSTTVRCLHCYRCASGWASASSSCSCWSCCSAAGYRACMSAQRRQQRTQTRRPPGGGGRCCTNSKQHGEGRGRGGIGWGAAESQHRGFCIRGGDAGSRCTSRALMPSVWVSLRSTDTPYVRPSAPRPIPPPTIFLLTRPLMCPSVRCLLTVTGASSGKPPPRLQQQRALQMTLTAGRRACSSSTASTPHSLRIGQALTGLLAGGLAAGAGRASGAGAAALCRGGPSPQGSCLVVGFLKG